MFTRNSVTVVTATTGNPLLGRCLQSVQQQTFPHVNHFVVPDGIEHRNKVHESVKALGDLRKSLCVMALPYPTGKLGWCGHRIYGAVSMLCNTEFVCFLDEDNWFEPDHIASLFTEIRAQKATWGFSLRRIFDTAGNFVAPDNCESLGSLHPTYMDENNRLIDTNCYLLGRDVAVAAAPAWYTPAPPNGIGADRIVTRFLLQNFPHSCCTRRHTVNYTAGNNPDSVQPNFFLDGNQRMRERYPDGLPWEAG